MTLAATVTKISSGSGHWVYQRLGSLAILAACLLLASTSFAEGFVHTLTVSRPPVTGAPPVTQSFIVSMPYAPAVPTVVVILLSGGDGNIQLSPTVNPLPITATSIATNVLTVTVNNASLAVGDQVYIQGTDESFLNGQTAKVASLTGSAPVYTGFTANFAASDYTNTSDTGTVSTYGLDVNSSNFKVRSRWLFGGHGYYVITLDSATDFQLLPNGLIDQEGSAAHVTDVLQVIAWARAQNPGLPVWVIGTSRATTGAFIAGQYSPGAGGPDGLVLTNPVNDSGDPDSVLAANLAGISVPVLILTDKGNTCPVTLASGDAAVVKALKSSTSPKVSNEVVAAGGLIALTSDCNALSDEGFFGVEDTTINKIALWIASAP